MPTQRPDTIVLIHGLWMTPRSWEDWIPHYERKGYRVLAPAYPGFEIEVEALRQTPDVIARLTRPSTISQGSSEASPPRRSSWGTPSAGH